MNEPMLTSLPASPDSHSQPELMACEQSPCAKLTPAAKPSSPKRGRESRSVRTLEPSAWVSPSKQDEVRGSLPPRPQDTGVPLNQMLAEAWPTPNAHGGQAGNNTRGHDRQDEILLGGLVRWMNKSGSLPLAFPASPPAGPGSKEARQMTVGSGRRLSRSLLPYDPLGDFSRILLESETWGSPEFYLTWKHKATRQGCLVWELAPSAPRTGECDTGLFAGAWPTVKASDEKQPHTKDCPGKTDAQRKKAGAFNSELLGNASGIRRGSTTSGCLARTEKFVVRLTTLSAWLMGYTAAYLAHWATASCGRSRKPSSKP